MLIYDSILDAIGRTPMVRLKRIPERDSAEVLVKIESLNPSGSIKARPALRIIEEAEKEGKLGPGSVIVEASSGNQGISLAMIGAVKGYKVVVFMPESMSQERRKILEAYGAEVYLTPAGRDMKETLELCIEESRSYAVSTGKAFLASQFENINNTRAHEQGTALEIIQQTGGRLDAFVSGIGTGGTITGVGHVLKRRIPGIKIIAAEPDKASLLGGGGPAPDSLNPAPGSAGNLPSCKNQGNVHLQEGIGDGIFPPILDESVVDRSILVRDDQAIETARRLAREEGIFAGISSGTNVFAALLVAREMGRGKRVVTVIPDGGEKYLSTPLCQFDSEQKM